MSFNHWFWTRKTLIDALDRAECRAAEAESTIHREHKAFRVSVLARDEKLEQAEAAIAEAQTLRGQILAHQTAHNRVWAERQQAVQMVGILAGRMRDVRDELAQLKLTKRVVSLRERFAWAEIVAEAIETLVPPPPPPVDGPEPTNLMFPDNSSVASVSRDSRLS